MNKSRIKSAVKQRLHVSWQHPAVKAAMPAVDAADAVVRRINGLRDLPPYSTRIRSRGVEKMFGGKSTAESSRRFARILVDHTGLTPESELLDIGCGCGLTALGFVDVLNRGNYTGIDVDRPSIAACLDNGRLAEARFHFQHIDVASDVYAGGAVPAATYRLPFPGERFTHVVLASVFTHMLPEEVENYLSEITRVLRPGGHVLFSTFLTDYGAGLGHYTFPHRRYGYSLMHAELVGKGVAYDMDWLAGALKRTGLEHEGKPLLGSWRARSDVTLAGLSDQDILIGKKSF